MSLLEVLTALITPVSPSSLLLMLRIIRSMSTGIKFSPIAGPIEKKMVEKLTAEFQPKYLSMENDSQKHAHHAGIRGATNTTESHFNLEIVSESFVGKNMPTRHRLVYKLLDDELKNDGVHALLMKTRTPEEYEKRLNQ